MFIKLSFHEKKSHLFLPFGRFAFPVFSVIPVGLPRGVVFSGLREIQGIHFRALHTSARIGCRFRTASRLGPGAALGGTGRSVPLQLHDDLRAVDQHLLQFDEPHGPYGSSGPRPLRLGGRRLEVRELRSSRKWKDHGVEDRFGYGSGGARVHALPAALRRHPAR